MTGTTTVITFVTAAVGFMNTALGLFPRDRASRGRTAAKARTMKRCGPTLLLALPLFVALAPQAADSTRTIDITLSRYAFSPDRIEMRLGEPVRLNIVSADGTHGFQVKEIGLNARIPGGRTKVTVELTPKKTGTFEIRCSEYCGSGHGRMRAWLIVVPST